MKKFNATNAIVILSLGLIFSVVVAGCGGNDTTESALTKNKALGSSGGGKGGSSTTSDTKTGSSGASANCTTIAAMTNSSITSTYFTATPNTLSKSELLCFSATQVNDYLENFTESQIAALAVNQLTAITATNIYSLSGSETQSFTTKQLKAMTDTQLQAILDSGEASDSQKVTINELLLG